ncbi:MAG: hypothetical protein C0485_18000 [Pirellula sp.]|nr:hypothetical protein [Pirellula sp.]
MSIIGRYLRRLIVIALVLGLSVGTCCSPTALAMASGGDAASEWHACGTFEFVASPHRLGRVGAIESAACQSCLAAAAEQDSAADDHVANAATRYAAAAPMRLTQALNKRSSAEAIPSRTLLSLGVCWRV